MVKLMRKKTVNKCLFFFAAAFILCTCNDPIFYTIAQEVRPIEPRIKGVATNFAYYDGRMFVASGNTLHAYNKAADPQPDQEPVFWDTETQPGGNIIQIAAAGSYLYALCSTDQNNDGKTVIRRFDKADSSWTEVDCNFPGINKINDIFSAGGILFIMAASSSTNYNNIYYSIFYIDNSLAVNELITDTGEVNGAAYDGTSYYLLTKDKGVYKIDNFSAPPALININVRFAGIISLPDNNNTVFLISRNGEAYTVKDSSIVKIENISMGRMATGALAVWRNPENPSERLLLAGRQDSLSYSYSYGYTYGYLELEFDDNGIKEGQNFVEPGREILTTVEYGQNERFRSTIGKYPVNHIFQVPSDIDSDMILFASTQKNGVWSHRFRSGAYQWNAEQ
jgi:hypothetical protein